MKSNIKNLSKYEHITCLDSAKLKSRVPTESHMKYI